MNSNSIINPKAQKKLYSVNPNNPMYNHSNAHNKSTYSMSEDVMRERDWIKSNKIRKKQLFKIKNSLTIYFILFYS